MYGNLTRPGGILVIGSGTLGYTVTGAVTTTLVAIATALLVCGALSLRVFLVKREVPGARRAVAANCYRPRHQA